MRIIFKGIIKAVPKKRQNIDSLSLDSCKGDHTLWIFYKNERVQSFDYDNLKDAIHDYKILARKIK